MKYLAILVLTVFFSPQLAAKKEEIIESGFKAFKEGGADLAWPAFTKGGPMEGSKEILAQASQFGQIDAYYGDYVSHEYISEKIIGENNKIIYLTLNLESGPLFGRFYLFKKPDGKWVIPNFNFHTNAEEVWPVSLYSNCSE